MGNTANKIATATVKIMLGVICRCIHRYIVCHMQLWRHCKNHIWGHFAARFSFSKRRYMVVSWPFCSNAIITT